MRHIGDERAEIDDWLKEVYNEKEDWAQDVEERYCDYIENPVDWICNTIEDCIQPREIDLHLDCCYYRCPCRFLSAMLGKVLWPKVHSSSLSMSRPLLDWFKTEVNNSCTSFLPRDDYGIVRCW